MPPREFCSPFRLHIRERARSVYVYKVILFPALNVIYGDMSSVACFIQVYLFLSFSACVVCV